MACLDSNDRECGTSQRQNCRCCLDCLPMASKCGTLDPGSHKEQTHYIFVGIYNHRRYFNDVQTVQALSDVVLKLDPQYAQRELPSSWLADLYDPFHDLSHFKRDENQVYPEGDQYIYELDPVRGKEVKEQVRVYRDRMTLLHIPNEEFADHLMLSFVGSNITHVLTSTRASPKTLFDFNGQPDIQPGRKVEFVTGRQPALWCAIFGGADGWAEVRAAKMEEPAGSFPIFATVVVAVLVLIIGASCCSKEDLLEAFRAEGEVPFQERLWCFVTRQSVRHESQAELMREQSMSGFVSSDVVDQTVEDQFLRRGGMGDDGI